MSDVPARGFRLVARVVLLQTGCALLTALLFAWKSAAWALAALAGGMIAAVGSGLFGWRAFAPGVANAGTLGRAMFAGWALKWLWYGVALYVALARLKLDALPLVVALLVAQLGYWAGVVRSR